MIWAYRDQMVHMADPDGLNTARGGPKIAAAAIWQGATPVSASGFCRRDVAPDALRVHALVRGLKPVRIDGGADVAAARYHRLAAWRGACPPGQSATVNRSGVCWPVDGWVVIDVARLVMLHGARATRPDWPVIADWRFKPLELVRHPSQKGGAYARGWFQHVQAEGVLPGDVVVAGLTHRVWRAALRDVRAALMGEVLTMWSVTQALPPSV